MLMDICKNFLKNKIAEKPSMKTEATFKMLLSSLSSFCVVRLNPLFQTGISSKISQSHLIATGIVGY